MSHTAKLPATRAENLQGMTNMLIAMACFTISDACMKLVAEMMPLYQAATIRSVLMLPMLVVMARWMGGLRLGGVARAWPVVTLRTLGEIGSALFFFLALVNLPLPIVTSILQSAPLMVTGAAAIFFGEKVGLQRFAAILIGFIGVLIIVRPGPEGVSIYAVAAILTVVCMVVRDLSSRRFPPELSSVGVAFVTAFVMLGVFGSVSLLRETWVAVPTKVWPLLIFSGVLVNVGYICIVRVMRVGDVAFTTAFRYSGLLWALLLGWLIWGFFPDAFTLAGAGLVVASGIFSLLRNAKVKA